MARGYISEGVVRPEWIDANGHMNVGYYGVAFDEGVDGLFESLSFGREYRRSTPFSSFSVESHMTYNAELMEGEAFTVESWLIAVDEKRLRMLQRLYKADGTLSATSEWLGVHIDMRTRRVTPFPAEIHAQLSAGLGQPEDGKGWGRAIAVPAVASTGAEAS